VLEHRLWLLVDEEVGRAGDDPPGLGLDETTVERRGRLLEASHDEQLRAAVSRGRALMEAAAVTMLARLGAADPVTAAGAIAACSEGLILHRIARHDETDPRPVYELLVHAALSPGQPQ